MNRRLPAEWEAQDGVLLAWPHADSDWRDDLAAVEAVFVHIAREISRFERVLIVAPKIEPVWEQLFQAGVDMRQVSLYRMGTNDTWARDFGPITVIEDDIPVLLDFGFNAWGLKFAADLDNQMTGNLARAGAFGRCEVRIPGLILEGGSIESDGAGTLLTTSQCLLSPNRNPHLDRQGIEQALGGLLGVARFLWLENGYLAGDDTDSHIDTLARLCPDDTIVYVRCEDQNDEHFAALAAMENELRTFLHRRGAPLSTHPSALATTLFRCRRPPPARHLRQFSDHQRCGAGADLPGSAGCSGSSDHRPRFSRTCHYRHRLPAPHCPARFAPLRDHADSPRSAAMNTIRVGLVQQRCTNDRQENIDKSIAGIREAKAQGARLVVLQELHCGPYFCQTEDTALF